MKITLTVTPNAKNTFITSLNDHDLKMKVKAPPVDGKANLEIIRYLSKTLRYKKSEIEILHGETGKKKLLNVPDDFIERLKQQMS